MILPSSFEKKTYDMVFQIRAEIWIFKIYIYIIVNTQEKNKPITKKAAK